MAPIWQPSTTTQRSHLPKRTASLLRPPGSSTSRPASRRIVCGWEELRRFLRDGTRLEGLLHRAGLGDLPATDREHPRLVHRALRRAQRRRFESRVPGHLTAT
jgi:hypothetical protein